MAQTKQYIMKELNPADLNVRIQNVKFTKKGRMVINCPSKQEMEELKKAVKVLEKEYEVSTCILLKPKIKITGYEGNNAADEIEKSLRKQNLWICDTDDINITYIKRKRNNASTVYAECSAVLLNKLMKFKKVHIGWKRCPAYMKI